MSELAKVLSSILILFLVGIIVKRISKLNLCILCQSVFITWIGGLILYYNNLFNSREILALMIGGSIVGIYYFLESKLENHHLKIFLFPLYLSMLSLGFLILGGKIEKPEIFILLIVWLIFILIYSLRKRWLQAAFKSLLECCRNW